MSTESATGLSVARSVSVPLTPTRAFELFTARMTEFWPPEHSILDVDRAEVVMEPRVGGRWFERGVDGSTCDWGRVLAWDPPRRVVLAWQISADWQFDPDLETEVEVTFTEEASPTPSGDVQKRTRLDLCHRHLERFGEHAEKMRATFESPDAWAAILSSYGRTAGA